MKKRIWKDHFKNCDPSRHFTESLFNPGASLGNVFISHCGVDTDRIVQSIVNQSILNRDRHFAHTCFLYSAKQTGPDGKNIYLNMVLTALINCACALVVATHNSKGHAWMCAEVDWLADHKKPICVCLLDDVDPGVLHGALKRYHFWLSWKKRVLIDFRGNRAVALSYLDEWIGSWPTRLPAAQNKAR